MSLQQIIDLTFNENNMYLIFVKLKTEELQPFFFDRKYLLNFHDFHVSWKNREKKNFIQTEIGRSIRMN